MRSKSPLDSLIAFVAIAVLLTLGGLALLGMGERLVAQGATPTPTEEPEAALALPTLTVPLETPTITLTPKPPTETPLPTRTPRPTRTPDATRTAIAEAQATIMNAPVAPDRTPLPTSTRFPTPTPRPIPVAREHYLFARPVSLDANSNPDTFYPYSTTGGDGAYAVHHGVEFVNPIGTEVYAAGAGEVIFAGSDEATRIGPADWSPADRGAFYGLAVIIRHDATHDGQPIFTLYGHLDSVETRVGRRVATGDLIGTIGMTGVALGPHLHFEVRLGENDYNATRNPQLWLVPYARHGTVVGRVLGANGERLEGIFLSIERLGSEAMPLRTTYSYSSDPVNPTFPDDEWDENFLFGDLPAGSYLVAARIDGRTVVQAVTVEAGRTSFVWLEPRR